MRSLTGGLVLPEDLALATDLYEFTMAAGYHASGRDDEAVFELFARKLPPERGFLVSCGLEQALHGLLNFRFSDEAVAFLDAVSKAAAAVRAEIA